MVTLSIDEDCGNAPKKQFISNLLVAVAEGNLVQARQYLSEEVSWTIVGEPQSEVASVPEQILQRLTADPSSTFRVDNILSHGKRCAANGTFTTDGSAVSFAHIFEFSGHGKAAVIRVATSYLIGVGSGGVASVSPGARGW